MKKFFCLLLIAVSINTVTAQKPAGVTPPKGKQWQLVPEMSDEFNGGFNSNKWKKTAANGWRGRSPGLFQGSAVSVSGGHLKIQAAILPKPITLKIDGKNEKFTHRGGIVTSKKPVKFGYYECRMRGNKTFMSSTFWMINKPGGSGCNNRTTELDITETVGVMTSGKQPGYNKRMNSNTHVRGAACPKVHPKGTKGQGAPIPNGALTSGKFHTYGAWWVNKNEIRFYLDGVFKYTVKPPSDFNLPMFLTMAVETYNFNPPPKDGGMKGNAAARTTSYDWVRSYRLK